VESQLAVNAGPFRDAVKMIYGYLTVLAITNSVREFAIFPAGIVQGGFPFTTSVDVWFTFVFSVFLILRFFFGNIAHFNSDQDNDPFEIIFDSSIIIVQAILLGYLTFFITDLSKFLAVVVIILISDFIWYAVSIAVAWLRRKASDLDRRVGLSQVITLVTISVYWLMNHEKVGKNPIVLLTDFEPTLISALVSFGVVNTILDLYNNGRRYVNFKEPKRAGP
jgi:hypothetical protein